MIKSSEFRSMVWVSGWAATLVAGLALSGCGAPQEEELAVHRSALTAVTISGVVTDTSGLTLDGVRVTLSGSSQASAVTSAFGEYSFTVNPGSYSVAASGVCASFEPGLVNLNNLTAAATADFVGSGGFCSPQTFSGGTSGTITVSGVVTSTGHPVAGTRITLAGTSQGFRISDEAGAYSFTVKPGAYSLRAAGGCSSFSPSVANLNNLARNVTQNFTGSGNCPTAPLALCPTLDPLFLGASEPAACNIVSTPECAFDRATSWDIPIVLDFANLIVADCRFGKWFDGPGALTETDVVNYVNDLVSFTLYFFGCPATGTQVGPLSFQLIPSAFQSRTFTTADTQALAAAYGAAIAQAISENASPPLTVAQTSAINAQVSFLAGRVPGLVSSGTFTSSVCP
jgi:hypothetical protein